MSLGRWYKLAGGFYPCIQLKLDFTISCFAMLSGGLGRVCLDLLRKWKWKQSTIRMKQVFGWWFQWFVTFEHKKCFLKWTKLTKDVIGPAYVWSGWEEATPTSWLSQNLIFQGLSIEPSGELVWKVLCFCSLVDGRYLLYMSDCPT